MTTEHGGRPEASRTTRRGFAALGAGAALTGLAGCLGGASGTEADDGPVVVASFFTFYDFARRIAAGTPVTVENLVPAGLHGHGWQPDPSIQRDVTEAEGFVHVGPGFQPWADRAIETVRAERKQPTLIDARAGVDLIPLADTAESDEAVEGARDPHFWLDPQRARTSVDNIAAGLTEVAPAHEDAFAANADALRGDLDDLDAEWRALFEAGDRDVAFLAAHNAFAYLDEAYDVAVEPLVVNLAASGDVRPADMERAQDLIAARDIEHIGAAVFEPIRPARQLLAETGVEAYFPVTPYAGTTEDWAERDWGYFDIAREVNMPTFEVLTGASDPGDVSYVEHGRNFEP